MLEATLVLFAAMFGTFTFFIIIGKEDSTTDDWK